MTLNRTFTSVAVGLLVFLTFATSAPCTTQQAFAGEIRDYVPAVTLPDEVSEEEDSLINCGYLWDTEEEAERVANALLRIDKLSATHTGRAPMLDIRCPLFQKDLILTGNQAEQVATAVEEAYHAKKTILTPTNKKVIKAGLDDEEVLL